MVQLECSCGFSCGTQTAFYRHVARFPDGAHMRLVGPSTPAPGRQRLPSDLESPSSKSASSQAYDVSPRRAAGLRTASHNISPRKLAVGKENSAPCRRQEPLLELGCCSAPGAVSCVRIASAPRSPVGHQTKAQCVKHMPVRGPLLVKHDAGEASSQLQQPPTTPHKHAPNLKCSSPVHVRVRVQDLTRSDTLQQCSPRRLASRGAPELSPRPSGRQRSVTPQNCTSGPGGTPRNCTPRGTSRATSPSAGEAAYVQGAWSPLGPAPARKPSLQGRPLSRRTCTTPPPSFAHAASSRPLGSTTSCGTLASWTSAEQRELTRVTSPPPRSGFSPCVQKAAGIRITSEVAPSFVRTLAQFARVDVEGQARSTASLQQQQQAPVVRRLQLSKSADLPPSRDAAGLKVATAIKEPTSAQQLVPPDVSIQQPPSKDLPNSQCMTDGDLGGPTVAELRRAIEAKISSGHTLSPCASRTLTPCASRMQTPSANVRAMEAKSLGGGTQTPRAQTPSANGHAVEVKCFAGGAQRPRTPTPSESGRAMEAKCPSSGTETLSSQAPSARGPSIGANSCATDTQTPRMQTPRASGCAIEAKSFAEGTQAPSASGGCLTVSSSAGTVPVPHVCLSISPNGAGVDASASSAGSATDLAACSTDSIQDSMMAAPSATSGVTARTTASPASVRLQWVWPPAPATKAAATACQATLAGRVIPPTQWVEPVRQTSMSVKVRPGTAGAMDAASFGRATAPVPAPWAFAGGAQKAVASHGEALPSSFTLAQTKVRVLPPGSSSEAAPAPVPVQSCGESKEAKEKLVPVEMCEESNVDPNPASDESTIEASRSGFAGSSRTPSTSSLSEHERSPQSVQPRLSFRSGQRSRRRLSVGLVYNPGSSTMIDSGNCRFSVARSSAGAQELSFMDGSLRVQPGPLPDTAVPAVQMQQWSSSPSARSSAGAKCSTAQASGSTALSGRSEATSSVSAAEMAERRKSRGTETLESFAEQTTEATGELFNRYVSAESTILTLRTFWQLLSRCNGGESESHAAEAPYRRISRLAGLSWRAQSVWSLLDRRAQLPEYASAPLASKRAVVCGSGPCGLRLALELALLGAQVVVVEKRGAADAFGRINRLHLWEWVKQDLLSWGAKIFDPPGGTFGGDNDFCHIGIGELQLLLLKNALLLGVHFRFDCKAKEVDGASLVCGNDIKLPCDFLYVADGANSTLSHALGLRSKAIGLRGKGSAIGVVANLKNSGDTDQKALRQFSWARQFNTPLFNRLKEETSMDLENIVYYKAQAHHYMVMTPTKRSLLEVGVLRDGQDRHLLHGSNVDIQRLSVMVQEIAAFFGLPTELCESQGVMIFDFSGIRRLENAATQVSNVFVCAVGDALLEPFWPEGLGIMRGFMSAFDAAHAAVTANDDADLAIAQTSATYNILKSVTAQSASQCMQKDSKQYRLDPASRYILSPSWMLPERSTPGCPP